MTGKCCLTGSTSNGLTRRLSKLTPSVLPGVLLLLLPKCPMCLAAWLTIATGLSFSASALGWVRTSIVLLWVVALGQLVWRRTMLMRQHR